MVGWDEGGIQVQVIGDPLGWGDAENVLRNQKGARLALLVR